MSGTPSSLYQDLQALLALQAIDTRIDRAKSALNALDNGTSAATRYNQRKTEAETRRAASHHALAEQKDAELRLASIEQKIANVNKTMYGSGSKSARELDNLRKELEMLGRQKDDTENKVLEAMEIAATVGAEADAADATLASATDDYRRVRATFKERSGRLTEEIAAAEKERASTLPLIPVAIVTRYDAIRTRRAGIGATQLEEDHVTCGACHCRINTTLIEDLQYAAVLQFCEHCGRILVPVPPLP